MGVYASHGFCVTIILADNQFESMRGDLVDLGVIINVVSHDEHISLWLNATTRPSKSMWDQHTTCYCSLMSHVSSLLNWGQLYGAPGLHQTKWPPFIIRSIFVSWMLVWCLKWHNCQEKVSIRFQTKFWFRHTKSWCFHHTILGKSLGENKNEENLTHPHRNKILMHGRMPFLNARRWTQTTVQSYHDAFRYRQSYPQQTPQNFQFISIEVNS
jgi:hypothetical protein